MQTYKWTNILKFVMHIFIDSCLNLPFCSLHKIWFVTSSYSSTVFESWGRYIRATVLLSGVLTLNYKTDWWYSYFFFLFFFVCFIFHLFSISCKFTHMRHRMGKRARAASEPCKCEKSCSSQANMAANCTRAFTSRSLKGGSDFLFVLFFFFFPALSFRGKIPFTRRWRFGADFLVTLRTILIGRG